MSRALSSLDAPTPPESLRSRIIAAALAGQASTPTKEKRRMLTTIGIPAAIAAGTIGMFGLLAPRTADASDLEKMRMAMDGVKTAHIQFLASGSKTVKGEIWYADQTVRVDIPGKRRTIASKNGSWSFDFAAKSWKFQKEAKAPPLSDALMLIFADQKTQGFRWEQGDAIAVEGFPLDGSGVKTLSVNVIPDVIEVEGFEIKADGQPSGKPKSKGSFLNVNWVQVEGSKLPEGGTWSMVAANGKRQQLGRMSMKFNEAAPRAQILKMVQAPKLRNQ